MGAVNELEVTFHGPFAFDFLKDKVTVYAPQCDGHLSSLQTDLEDRSLPGRDRDARSLETFKFELKGSFGVSDPLETSCANARDILLVDNSRRREPAPNPLNCYWQLEVPRPNVVEGLIPD